MEEKRRVVQRRTFSENLLNETNDNQLGAMMEYVPCLVDLC
jgi:hypothetical protein